MGNHGAKTYPSPQAKPTSNFESLQLVVDQKVIISPPIQTETIRKQRSPRETPDLYVYASYRNWDLARKQIELHRGLDYISTNRRFSVLHVAVENNAPVDVVKFMLAKGIDANIAETLFQQAPLHILMKILDEGNSFDILKTLLEAGADVNCRAKYGRTPLYCAIKYRVPERAVIHLLKSGALVHSDELIFAREKSTRSIAMTLEKVAILTCICSTHLGRRLAHRSKSPIGILPMELYRELKKYLYP